MHSNEKEYLGYINISMIYNDMKIYINRIFSKYLKANIIDFWIEFHQIPPFVFLWEISTMLFSWTKERVDAGGCSLGDAWDRRGRGRGEERERERGGFYRDCCNSITVTRDARIGNVTNHET